MSSAKVKKAERQAPFKCLRCLSRFDTWNWRCADGQKHVVDSKTYFLPDEPVNCGLSSEGQIIKMSRVVVTNVPPPHPELLANLPAGGDDSNLGAGWVEFVNGRFSTQDAEQIFWLNQRGGFCTEKEWQKAWLTLAELNEIEMAESVLENKRLEDECNELRQAAER